MATQAEGAASAAACISDDEEDLPPPPSPSTPQPPPPSPSAKMSTEPLVFQRQRRRIIEARNLRLATKFHRQVVLLRCFRGWKDQTELTKQMLRDACCIMKRTLLLWHDEAMRLIEQRKALGLFNSIAFRCQRRLLVSAFTSWNGQARQDGLIESTFVAWREETRTELITLRANEAVAMQSSHRSLMKSAFTNWKYEALLSNYRRRCNRKKICDAIAAWRARTDCETKTRQEALKAITKHRRNQTARRVFGVWRLDAKTTTTRRDAISTVLRISNESIQRQVLSAWLQVSVACTRFDQASSLLSSTTDKVQIRGALISWSGVTALIVQQEKVMLAKILSRWSILVEERKQRRVLNEMALQQWACNICKRSLRQWKDSVEAIREEQKAMFRRSMHSSSHSHHHMSSSLPSPLPVVLPSSSLLPNSSISNGVTTASSGFLTSFFFPGRGSTSRPSVDSLKSVSTTQANPTRVTSASPSPHRHDTFTAHRTQMVAKEWTTPTTYQNRPRQQLSQLNKVGKNRSGVSSASNSSIHVISGSPFGVRIPSWIQEEMSGRHQTSIAPRYR